MLFGLIRRLRALQGYDKHSAETVDRLTYSMHVEDLRWVARVTMLGAILAVSAIVIIVPIMGKVCDGSKVYDALVPFQISAVLAGAGGVLAWCYKTGSERLGIVDLFACEITTLCRICTINGLTDTCIASFELDGSQHDELRERFTHFDSSEAYTPVFDANAKELQSLNVKVVTNITAFYTYWKSTRDAFRRLANTQATATAALNLRNDAWHRAMRNVIYMQFLTLESARKAVRDLIEFEPASAENTITILLSELPAYRFLLNNFEEGDVRHTRLKLRRDRYLGIVSNVYYYTKSMHGDVVAAATKQFPARKNSERLSSKEFRLRELRCDWDKAHSLLKELESRCRAAIGEFPSEAPGKSDLAPRRGLGTVRSWRWVSSPTR
jgi:hypothetical protein